MFKVLQNGLLRYTLYTCSNLCGGLKGRGLQGHLKGGRKGGLQGALKGGCSRGGLRPPQGGASWGGLRPPSKGGLRSPQGA